MDGSADPSRIWLASFVLLGRRRRRRTLDCERSVPARIAGRTGLRGAAGESSESLRRFRRSTQEFLGTAETVAFLQSLCRRMFSLTRMHDNTRDVQHLEHGL